MGASPKLLSLFLPPHNASIANTQVFFANILIAGVGENLSRAILKHDSSHSSGKQKEMLKKLVEVFASFLIVTVHYKAKALKFFCFCFLSVLENRKNHIKSRDEATGRQNHLKKMALCKQKGLMTRRDMNSRK